MIDPQSQAILKDVVRRESRSLLSYIGDAYPWATAADEIALGRLRAAVASSKEAIGELGAYLARRRVTMPFLGSYPMSFTSFNFVALAYLLPQLEKSEAGLTAALEADVVQLSGEAREQAEKPRGVMFFFSAPRAFA